MQPGTLAYWENERGAFVLPVYQLLAEQQGEEAAEALRRFEEHLLSDVDPPYAIADIVDEEFALLAVAVGEAGGDLTGLFLPYQPRNAA